MRGCDQSAPAPPKMLDGADNSIHLNPKTTLFALSQAESTTFTESEQVTTVSQLIKIPQLKRIPGPFWERPKINIAKSGYFFLATPFSHCSTWNNFDFAWNIVAAFCRNGVLSKVKIYT